MSRWGTLLNDAQTAQQEALAIFDQIATASATQSARREQMTTAESTESSDSQTMFDESLIPQCELLLNMQRRLADRIAGLTQAQRERGVLTTSEQQELSLLAEQQAQLHNHARRILGGQADREKRNSGDPADAPE